MFSVISFSFFLYGAYHRLNFVLLFIQIAHIIFSLIGIARFFRNLAINSRADEAISSKIFLASAISE